MAHISIKKAAAITAVSKYINIFLGIFFSAILSRILTPHDYGIVAIVTVFTAFFLVLSNIGFGIAVIQNKDFGEKEINSLFTFSVYAGLALSGIFILLAYPIALFYGNKIYIPICLVLSISIFFNTINAVPDGLLRKDKKFFLIALRLIIVSLLTYGFTIILALLNFKYYALVFQSIISSVLIFAWNLRNVKVRFIKNPDKSVLKRIRGYSGYQFLFNFVNYFSRNLDKLIIGKILGNEELAQYNKAYHFMLYPVQNLTNVITPVLHPILSDYQNDKNFIYQKYLKILKLLSLIGVFVMPLCFCCAREIILIIYGPQWDSAVICFKFLTLAIWTQMIQETSGSIFTALGDTKRMFYTCCINTVLVIIGLCTGFLTKSIIIISFAIMITLNLQFFVTFTILISITIKQNFFNFIRNFLPDILIIAILFASSFALNKIQITANLLVSFIIKGGALFAVYLIFILLFKQIQYFLPILPGKIKNKFLKKSKTN